jgi:predicted NBD/HSP70 family sugar kinase
MPSLNRGTNLASVRHFNDRILLQTLRIHGPQAKVELARLTGLTAQSIGLIVQRLENDGLLIRQQPVRGKVGQPSVPIALDPTGAYSIGIKIGRRGTDFLLVDFLGRIQERQSLSYVFPDSKTLFPIIKKTLQGLEKRLDNNSQRLAGIGVAAPFQFGGWHRMLGLSAKQADQWNSIDLSKEVQAMTRAPVSFAKDTTAACVAEMLLGYGRQRSSFLYFYVDTFVGGGLVLNSRLYAGGRGNAGAVASLPLQLANRKLSPAKQSPEQLVGQASLWDLESAFAADGLDTTAAYDHRVNSKPWTKHTAKWLKSAANALAHGIVSGTAIVDTNAVLIDGVLPSAVMDLLIAETQAALQLYNWEGLWQPQLFKGSIGAAAPALGGALLPLHDEFMPISSAAI